MIVLDTNVLSELMRPLPDAGVESWMASQPASSLFTTTITQAEILFGISALPIGERRSALQRAATEVFETDLAGRVLPFDSPRGKVLRRSRSEAQEIWQTHFPVRCADCSHR